MKNKKLYVVYLVLAAIPLCLVLSFCSSQMRGGESGKELTVTVSPTVIVTFQTHVATTTLVPTQLPPDTPTPHPTGTPVPTRPVMSVSGAADCPMERVYVPWNQARHAGVYFEADLLPSDETGLFYPCAQTYSGTAIRISDLEIGNWTFWPPSFEYTGSYDQKFAGFWLAPPYSKLKVVTDGGRYIDLENQTAGPNANVSVGESTDLIDLSAGAWSELFGDDLTQPKEVDVIVLRWGP